MNAYKGAQVKQKNQVFITSYAIMQNFLWPSLYII